MKKLFTLLCLSVLTFGATAAMAEGYQGSAPAEGTFYLYNVGTGLWLGENYTHTDYWTTKASLEERGLDFELVALADGAYKIVQDFSGLGFLPARTEDGYDLYLDYYAPEMDPTPWTFALVEGTADTYTITGVDQNGGLAPLGTNAGGYASSHDATSNFEWKLVTREDRIAYEYSIASSTNPVNMSWLIPNGTMPSGDNRSSLWLTEGSCNYGTCSTGMNYYGRECWNISDYKYYQNIASVPNGKYTFYGDAIYTSTGDGGMSEEHYYAYLDGSEPTLGYIFANDVQTPMVNMYSLPSTTQDWADKDVLAVDGLYFPLRTAGRLSYMAKGQGTTETAEVDVTDGTLTTGFAVEGNEGTAWIVLHSITLYYYGDGTNDVVAEPTPYTGSAPAEGTFYLYNVDTGLWLGENYFHQGYYTTHADLSVRGLDFDLTALGDGAYQIDPKFGASNSLTSHLNAGYDLYMDVAASVRGVTPWTFALVDGTADTYTITGTDENGDPTPLGIDDYGYASSRAATSAFSWKLVSREDRIAYEKSIASDDNPVDMSWLVSNGTLADRDIDTRYSAWDSSQLGSLNSQYYWDKSMIYNNVLERWGITDFSFTQQLTDVPNGTYKVNGDAIYTSTGDGDMNAERYNGYLDGSEPTLGYVVANDGRGAMVNAYSLVTTEEVTNYNTKDLGNGYWAPRNRAQRHYYLLDGKGVSDYAETVVEDGNLEVGVCVENATNGVAWIVWNTIRVYYYGDGATTREETPYTGSAPAEGSFYLYNVGTGLWLGENYTHTNYWTTKASLEERGLDFELVALEEGAYKIVQNFSGLGFLPARTEDGYDLYLDYYSPAMDATPWTFALVEGTDDTYTITGKNQNGGLAPLGTNANGYASSRDAIENFEWKLVTRDDRIAYEKSIASDDNPVNMSWLIPNGTMPSGDNRSSLWLSEGTCNSGTCSTGMNYYGRECWNISDYKYYQNIASVPNGKYTFYGDAIYTSTGDGDMSAEHYYAYLDGSEPTLGYIFANDVQTPMVNMYSLPSETKDWTDALEVDGKYFPLRTAGRMTYMANGQGTTDTAEVTVTDGTLTTGFAVEGNEGTAWIVIHSINLYYCGGDDGTATALADITPGDYYLYNVGTDTYLGENNTNTNWYTTRAELSSRGRAFGITKSTNGGYNINPYMGGNHTLNAGNINPNDPTDGDLYMDTSFPITNWIITAADNEGEYYITSFGYKLGATADGLATTDADAAAYDTWQIITREERIAKEKAAATADNPVDMSWLILGGTFPKNDEYKDAFTATGDAVDGGISGDYYYHCNAVWELYGITTVDVCQQINDIPNGIYKLNANAVYVSTDGSDCSSEHYDAYYNGTEPTLGYVYANNDDVLMRNIYETDLLTTEYVADHNTKDLDNGYWAYNGYNEFSTNYFEGKGYTDYVETTVTDGTLTVGARVDGAGELTRQWILLDNFTLYYYGSADADLYERLCDEIDALRTALADAWAVVEANVEEYGSDIPEDLIERKEAIEQDIADLQAAVDNYYANDELAAQESTVEADITEIQGKIDALITAIETGINSVVPTETTTTGVYTITGQKVSAPTTKGIYIINGKKVLVK